MADQTKLDIELMKKDISILTHICEKMDGTIDKMQQVSVDLSRLVYLQEQKHILQDKINNDIMHESKDTHNVMKFEIREMNNKIESLDNSLSEKIRQVSQERKIGYNNLSSKMEESQAKILQEINTLKENVNSKITEINIWRYTTMGAIAIVAFIVSKFIDIAKIFH